MPYVSGHLESRSRQIAKCLLFNESYVYRKPNTWKISPNSRENKDLWRKGIIIYDLAVSSVCIVNDVNTQYWFNQNCNLEGMGNGKC